MGNSLNIALSLPEGASSVSLEIGGGAALGRGVSVRLEMADGDSPARGGLADGVAGCQTARFGGAAGLDADFALPSEGWDEPCAVAGARRVLGSAPAFVPSLSACAGAGVSASSPSPSACAGAGASASVPSSLARAGAGALAQDAPAVPAFSADAPEGAPAPASEEPEPQGQPQEASKKKGRLGDILFYGVLVLLVVGAFFLTGGTGSGPRMLAGYSAFTVTTGSMHDVLPQGSLIVTKQVDPETLQVGDDITYMANETASITHRIISIEEDYLDTGQPAFQTQGTMNAKPDSKLVPAANVVGKVVFCSYELGVAVGFIQGNWPLLLFLVIVAAALFAALRRILR